MKDGKLEAHLRANMNSYLPLRDIVFHTLRQAILMGDLEPGERLLEVSLAEKLGVSRTPVREAIRKLELEGLVLMMPRRGAEVAKISEKNLRDVLEVRRGLEELSMELAVLRMEDDKLAELEDVNAAFEKKLSGTDLTAIAEADERFHMVIYEATGNERLVQVINNIKDQMYRYRLEYIKDKEKRKGLFAEHQQIIETLKAKDVPRAKLAIKEHIDNQEATIMVNLREEAANEKKGKR